MTNLGPEVDPTPAKPFPDRLTLSSLEQYRPQLEALRLSLLVQSAPLWMRIASLFGHRHPLDVWLTSRLIKLNRLSEGNPKTGGRDEDGNTHSGL